MASAPRKVSPGPRSLVVLALSLLHSLPLRAADPPPSPAAAPATAATRPTATQVTTTAPPVPARASSPPVATRPTSAAPSAAAPSKPASGTVGQQVRQAVDTAKVDPPKAAPRNAPPASVPNVAITVRSSDKPADVRAQLARAKGQDDTQAKPAAPFNIPGRIPNPADSRAYIQARAAALATQAKASAAAMAPKPPEVHWAYDGEGAPEFWGRLKPEYGLCANGKRQSPIHIQRDKTLQGPAEPLQLLVEPSGGTVVNNGHTIQVNVVGDNTLTIRGTTYALQQLHFHHPGEERVNHRQSPMGVHLVHRSASGQLAVVAVGLEVGETNPLIHTVWTHLPLETGERLALPPDSLRLQDLIPEDPRYYHFMGSLTTPPCTEGVLWIVMKQPVRVSRDQIRLFGQLYPMNARPVQALNDRIVREAQ